MKIRAHVISFSDSLMQARVYCKLSFFSHEMKMDILLNSNNLDCCC